VSRKACYQENEAVGFQELINKFGSKAEKAIKGAL
jgi:hypothetical protein